jgi:hypothetical protein
MNIANIEKNWGTPVVQKNFFLFCLEPPREYEKNNDISEEKRKTIYKKVEI